MEDLCPACGAPMARPGEAGRAKCHNTHGILCQERQAIQLFDRVETAEALVEILRGDIREFKTRIKELEAENAKMKESK